MYYSHALDRRANSGRAGEVRLFFARNWGLGRGKTEKNLFWLYPNGGSERYMIDR